MFKKISLLFILTIASNSYAMLPLPKVQNDDMTICDDNDAPKLAKKIENWEIVAGNKAYILTKDGFSGKDLYFRVFPKRHNRKNTITINNRTGAIVIDAQAKDNFDVRVVAKNACGFATAEFNVQVDEDE